MQRSLEGRSYVMEYREEHTRGSWSKSAVRRAVRILSGPDTYIQRSVESTGLPDLLLIAIYAGGHARIYRATQSATQSMVSILFST